MSVDCKIKILESVLDGYRLESLKKEKTKRRKYLKQGEREREHGFVRRFPGVALWFFWQEHSDANILYGLVVRVQSSWS
jgi:hypothetical protein